MSWAKTFSIASCVVLALAACADHVSSPASADRERNQLVERALALKANVLKSGRITPELRRELEDIQHDIGEWQENTGRNDISVSTSEPIKTQAGAASAIKSPGSVGGASCLPCPPVTADATQICFLVEGNPCPTGAPGELTLHVCAYVCIKVEGASVPIVRR